MFDALRNPRTRALILILLLFVVFALAWHVVGAADNAMAMLGACSLALAVAGLLLRPPGNGRWHLGAPEVPFRAALRVRIGPFRAGRHPPQEGTLLLS